MLFFAGAKERKICLKGMGFEDLLGSAEDDEFTKFAEPKANSVADIWLRSSSPFSPVVRSFFKLINQVDST